MKIQSLGIGHTPGHLTVARWQAAAIIAVLHRSKALAAEETTGEEPILTPQGDATSSHGRLLAEIAANRDREAFKVLFAYFAPRLKTWLSNLGMPAERAEDLAQDTLVTVWQKAHLYRPEKAAVSTWIFQIARNKFIDQRRKHKYPEVEVEHYVNELVAADETDAPLRQERISKGVSRALARLNPAQREVVELSFYEELSHSQIARRLQLPLGTVKSRIRIAFELLRKELGEYK